MILVLLAVAMVSLSPLSTRVAVFAIDDEAVVETVK